MTNKITRRKAVSAGIAAVGIAALSPLTSGANAPDFDKTSQEKEFREGLKRQSRAYWCLYRAGGFGLDEIAQVCKDIAKSRPIHHRHGINFRRKFTNTRYEYHGAGDGLAYTIANAEAHMAWAAICMTFRTQEDGFKVLNIPEWWA